MSLSDTQTNALSGEKSSQTPSVEKRLPDKLKIIGMEYPVIQLATGHEDAANYSECWLGHIETKHAKIVLNSDCPPNNPETLLHEVIHAVDAAVCADLKEEQVGAISRGLFAVMRDNPDFVRFVMEGYDSPEDNGDGA